MNLLDPRCCFWWEGEEQKPPTTTQIQLIILVSFGLATATLVLRVYVRLRMRNQGREDWLLLAAWICNVALIVLVLVALAAQNVDRVRELSRNDASVQAVQLSVLVLSLLVPLLAKISVVFLLTRLFGVTSSWRRRFLLGSVAIFALFSLTTAIVGIVVRTTEPGSDFEPEGREGLPRHFIDLVLKLQSMLMCWSALGGVLDLIYSVMALALIRSTRMNIRRKLGLGLIFGLGCTAGSLAVIRASSTNGLVGIGSWYDFTASTGRTIQPWAFSEGAAIIFCANLPALVPLWEHIRHGRGLQPERPTPPSMQARRQSPRTGQMSQLLNLGALSHRGNFTDVAVGQDDGTIKPDAVGREGETLVSRQVVSSQAC